MSDSTEEIRARVEKASCGPWQVIRKGEADHDWLLASFGAASDDDRQVELHTKGVRGDGLSSAENDAEFCAHARTDIPYLLTELQKVAADRNRYIQRAGSAEGRLEVMEADLQALREENARLKVGSRHHPHRSRNERLGRILLGLQRWYMGGYPCRQYHAPAKPEVTRRPGTGQPCITRA